MIKVENPEACTGCLICVLACSFHHTRKYSRSQSSIEVNKSIFSEEKKAEIVICRKEDSMRPICDMCKEDDFPLCIQFCPENVFKVKRRQE